jgi:UDP-N-acetylglucosamine--N-acetylmuramyl-(pentapeptide) pyrophosphoryl-undecaprenol N-acetylglucosamine transferase
VPYLYAADDHQTRNAEIFVKARAALLLKESELTGELLAQKIRELLNDIPTLRAMSENASALAPKNAATMVVETMEKYRLPNDAVAA